MSVFISFHISHLPRVCDLVRGGSRLKCPESDYSFSGLFFAVAQPERTGKRNGKISISARLGNLSSHWIATHTQPSPNPSRG